MMKILRLLIICVGITITTSCQNSTDKQYIYQKRELSPAELRKELMEKEMSNPLLYLNTKITWRTNFWGTTILEGTINNNATLANFKDVVLKIVWLSKTNTEISSIRKIIYEYVPAGHSINIELKFDAPSDMSDVSIGVVSATPAQLRKN